MKNWKRLLATLLALVLVSTMFTGLALAEEKHITEIKFTKDALEKKLEGGPVQTVSLTNGAEFTVDPADATDNIIWEVDDDSIAYVSGYTYGVDVESKKPGKVTVTAKAIDQDNKPTGYTKSFTVDFQEVAVKKVTLSEYSLKIGLNDTDNFKWWIDSFEPANATYANRKYVEWTSNNDNIVVKKDGSFVAKKLGKSTVTGTVKDTGKATVTIEVEIYAKPITGISFSPASFELKAGNDNSGEKLDPENYMTIEPEGLKLSNAKKTTWSSSDPEIFDVSTFRAGSKAGTATVTVEVINQDDSKVTGTLTVKVVAVELKGLSFTKSSIALPQNKSSLNLSKYIKKDPADAFIEDGALIWESSDEEIVEVDQSGYIWKGKKEGSATITVSLLTNPSISASIEVTTEKRKISEVKFNEKKINLYFVKKDGKAQDDRASGYVSFSIEPSNATYKSINVETTNAKVAIPTLYDGGVSILPVGKGSCKITLYVNDGKNNYTAQLKVKVSEKTPAAKLNKKTLTLEVGKKFTLKATDSVTKDSLKGKWSSSDKSVAKVDKKGKVKAVGAGRAVITFTPKDKNMKPITCVVKVK